MCASKQCSVCECDPGEVPQPWVAAEERSCAAAGLTGQEDCSSVTCECAAREALFARCEHVTAASRAHPFVLLLGPLQPF